nr:phage virion morphogenesis protein [uncultured Pseudomonas sp.]
MFKTKGTSSEAITGFTGRASRLAYVHQSGLKDRAEPGAPEVRYARRELIGLSPEDLDRLRTLVVGGLVD